MEKIIADRIKVECERIEQNTGFGQVMITIQDGKIHMIKPTPHIMAKDILAPKLDKVH